MPMEYFHIQSVLLVGMTGFEPATSCSPSTRSDQTELHPEGQVEDKKTGRQDLNLRPPASEAGALDQTGPRPGVGTGGLEPPTPAFVVRRSIH